MTKHDALRKQRIIEYIATSVRESGYPPSVREIAAAVGLASTSAVHHHLSALEKEGMLERDATQSRALRLTPSALLSSGSGSDVLARGPEPGTRTIPVIGEMEGQRPSSIDAKQPVVNCVELVGVDQHVVRLARSDLFFQVLVQTDANCAGRERSEPALCGRCPKYNGKRH